MNKVILGSETKDGWNKAGFFDEFDEVTGPRQRSRWKRALGPATLAVAVAVGPSLLGSSHNQQSNAQPVPATRATATKTQSPNHTKTSLPIGPSTIFNPKFQTLACSNAERTIRPGDNVFNLTTEGLRGHGFNSFMNDVYNWNTQVLGERARTDPALKNLNNIPIGHKITILNHCIEVSPVWGDPEFSDRWIDYQDYQGTDHKIHHDVDVTYKSSSDGRLVSVQSCDPGPECYSFVAGAPPTPDYFKNPA